MTQGTIVMQSAQPSTFEPLYLMLYSEGRFVTPHYQSIRPLPGNQTLRNVVPEQEHSLQQNQRSRIHSLDSNFQPGAQSSQIPEICSIDTSARVRRPRANNGLNETNILDITQRSLRARKNRD